MNIPFSPPDISELEIEEVVDTLKSGWITTGHKTKRLEENISKYCGTNKSICLNSATAGLELTLRLFNIGEGDEVITTAYTYTATASVIVHVGAKIVMVDTQKDSYEMDYDKLSLAITNKTKAIIPVDIGGVICNYEKIFDAVLSASNIFKPNGFFQEKLGRILVLADAAHSFGAIKNDVKSGNIADFTAFSFHAVKNFTTAEGGALTWKRINGVDDTEIYKHLSLMSLHGQNKDALAKTSLGSWEYDIIAPYYKCNMTDIAAAIGIAQLKRYEEILKIRMGLVKLYESMLKSEKIEIVHHHGENYKSSCHLLLVRIKDKDEDFRNLLVKRLAEVGVSANVHYKPLPMLTAYKNLGFNIANYPNAYNQYKNEITLPLFSTMTKTHVTYVCEQLNKILVDINSEELLKNYSV